MEKQTRNKGGRPRKEIKRDVYITIKCTHYEKKAIESKAKAVHLSTSEYLRDLGLKGKVDLKNRSLGKEILSMTGTLNHLAANLNQIAKKRNSLDELNPLERARLNVQSIEVKQLAILIKEKLK
ncbi:mobilization protein [Pelobium manganitolerans]|uniref:Mobilization protein n=1 Tax=Pelobium manganitolerans TaxID=1842495 RepID=A0A419S1L6_9SPHI|nr:mobilization protein [Pelobium manganitolerans]RKD12372.1 mobilization protein [Pelobium manganitolerans]